MLLLLESPLYKYNNVVLHAAQLQLQFVEHSNRRKIKSYSMRRKNSISAIIFIWFYFVAISIFVVWLGRFAPLRQVAILSHGLMARRSASIRSCI